VRLRAILKWFRWVGRPEGGLKPLPIVLVGQEQRRLGRSNAASVEEFRFRFGGSLSTGARESRIHIRHLSVLYIVRTVFCHRTITSIVSKDEFTG
jgi:hypothetical protein